MAQSAGVAESVPTSFSLPDVSCPRCRACQPSARAAATASPPVRADVSKSTASQGRAGGRVRRERGRARLGLTAVLHLRSRTEAASPSGLSVFLLMVQLFRHMRGQGGKLIYAC